MSILKDKRDGGFTALSKVAAEREPAHEDSKTEMMAPEQKSEQDAAAKAEEEPVSPAAKDPEAAPKENEIVPELTVEEKVVLAEKQVVEWNRKLDKATSWFATDGCLKVLVIFSALAVIAFAICMFLLGRQVAKTDHQNTLQTNTLAEIKKLQVASDLKVSITAFDPAITASVKTQALDAGTLALGESDDKATIAAFVAAKMNSYKKGSW